jgi:predicted nucleic acid-binding protein
LSAFGELLYLDSSALVKLVVEEAESRALEALVAGFTFAVSSVIAAIEVPRVACRTGVPEVEGRADRLVAKLDLLQLTDGIVQRSARLERPTLRTLDAIHLASALSLGAELDAFAAYDERLVEAGAAAGVNVVSPT